MPWALLQKKPELSKENKNSALQRSTQDSRMHSSSALVSAQSRLLMVVKQKQTANENKLDASTRPITGGNVLKDSVNSTCAQTPRASSQISHQACTLRTQNPDEVSNNGQHESASVPTPVTPKVSVSARLKKWQKQMLKPEDSPIVPSVVPSTHSRLLTKCESGKVDCMKGDNGQVLPLSTTRQSPAESSHQSIPKASVSARLRQGRNQIPKPEDSLDVLSRQAVPYSSVVDCSIRLPKCESSKGAAENVGSSRKLQSPDTASPVRKAKPELRRQSLPIYQHPNELLEPTKTTHSPTQSVNSSFQQNIFRRKAPGETSQVASSRGNPNKSCPQCAFKPKDKSDEQQQNHRNILNRQLSSKASKGAMHEFEQSWTFGTESSHSYNRSDVITELQNVRTLVEQVEMMDYEISCPTFEEDESLSVQTDLYLVVDTNVIIENMSLIKNLKTALVKGMTPKLIVPWQVLKELDYLKERKQKVSAVHQNARKGIKFLLDEIILNTGFVSGQPQHVASRNDNFAIECPDDHLIKCCLQLKTIGHSVLLLTNDRNLVLKAVVTNVPAIRSDALNKLLNEEQEPPCGLTCFESPPYGSFPQNQLALVTASHQIIVLLKKFLSAVVKKYLTTKYQCVWRLRAPGPEPWPLTTLLDKAFNIWDEYLGTRWDKGAMDDILYLRRFINKVNYDNVRYNEMEHVARVCHQLAGSLPAFGEEGATFDHCLSFWKLPEGSEPPPGITFVASCVSLTVHHLNLLENNLVGYCLALSRSVGVRFDHPKIDQVPPTPVNVNLLSRHVSSVKNIGIALERMSAEPIGTITRLSSFVRTIYDTLVYDLGEMADPRFFVEDVVLFCNDGSMRQFIPSALHSLRILLSFSETVSLRLASNTP